MAAGASVLFQGCGFAIEVLDHGSTKLGRDAVLVVRGKRNHGVALGSGELH